MTTYDDMLNELSDASNALDSAADAADELGLTSEAAQLRAALIITEACTTKLHDAISRARREDEMDSFDIAYERARANGWED